MGPFPGCLKMFMYFEVYHMNVKYLKYDVKIMFLMSCLCSLYLILKFRLFGQCDCLNNYDILVHISHFSHIGLSLIFVN
jgi:hypothetical protein